MRLLIADDHLSVAQGLAAIVAGPADAVTFATTPDEGERALRSSQFDLIILDLDFRGHTRSGFHLIEIAGQVQPGTPALIWSMFGDPALVQRARGAGAAGFVAKEASAAALRDAVAEVLQGRPSFTIAAPPLPIFTERQIRVMQLLQNHLDRKEIAGTLGVTTSMIDQYITTIGGKLGVHGLRAVCAEIERRALHLLAP